MNSNEIDDENLDLIALETTALDLSDEVWLPIIGYEGKYEISNYGRVLGVQRGRYRTLTRGWDAVRCSLYNKGKGIDFSITASMDVYFPKGHHFVPDNYEYLNSLNTPNKALDDLEGEIWRDISGYEGVFQISDKGRVKGLERTSKYTTSNGNTACRTNPEMIFRCGEDAGGYKQVTIAYDGVPLRRRIHRLVANAFIPNPNNLPQVNHIDGNKHNNTVENLEWMTSQENIIHAHTTGLASPKSGAEASGAKLTWDDVRFIRANTELSRKELALRFGVVGEVISNVVKYKTYKNDPMEENK